MERESEPVYLYSLFYFYMVFVIASLANLHTHALPIQGTLYFKSQYYHPSISALPIESVHLSGEECQEFPDKFPGTNYGEKNPSEIMAKIPDNVTLTLHQVKFLEKTPGTTNGVKYLASFLVT